MEKGKRPTAVFAYLCVCVCVCAMCKLYTKRPFLMAFHSLTFGQTSCRYMSSSRWSHLKLPFSSSWYYRPKKTRALGRWWVHWNVDIARRDWSLFKWRKPAHCSHCLSSLRELPGLKSFFLARNICTTIFSIINFSRGKPWFDSVFGLSVILVIQVISHKTDVTNYSVIFRCVPLDSGDSQISPRPHWIFFMGIIDPLTNKSISSI